MAVGWLRPKSCRKNFALVRSSPPPPKKKMKRSEYHGCIFGGFFFGGGKIQVKTAEIPLVNAKLGAVDDEMRDEQNKTSTLQEAIKV